MNNIKQMMVVGLSGLLFGIGLVISGMADPVKVIGFLDVTGQWDPSLAFVMGGALLVFVPCYQLLIKPRQHAVSGADIQTPSSSHIDKKLLCGAALFGAGWGLLGVCPGPAFASALAGNGQVWVFLAALGGGSLFAKGYLAQLVSKN